MNSVAKSYLRDKKFLNLWAPYSALLPQVKEFSSALFEAPEYREEISGSTLRSVAQEILSNAILQYPVHQVEKIAYRINETLKGIITKLEESYPDEDLRQARIELNHFEGMQAYALRIAQNHDWSSLISLTKVMATQRVGSKKPDAELANQVLGAILESGAGSNVSDTQALDEFLATAAQVPELFTPPRFNFYTMNPSVLIHALQRVADGTYSLDRPEVSEILKVMFFSLGERTNVMGGEQSMLRAIEAIDHHFDNDEQKFQLISQFNRVFYARNRSTNQDCLNPFYFALLIKPEKPDYLRAMLQGTFKWTWQSRAAVDACLQKPDNDCTADELIVKMINMPVKQANEWPLCYNFAVVFEAMFNVTSKGLPNEDYYRVDWRTYTLEVKEPNGRLLLRVLADLLPETAINVAKMPSTGQFGSNSSAQMRISREMESDALRRIKDTDNRYERFQLYWAAIVACGEADAARQVLSDFWKGNFKALKAWVDAFNDDMANYSHFEWLNEDRLQADLGL